MVHPTPMFANFLNLVAGRTPPAYERGFVREVTVVRRTERHPRTEKLILGGWALILAKSWLVIWLVGKYHVPVNADWIIAPTVIFAAVCTAVYYWRT
jgi:hypothetical protein